MTAAERATDAALTGAAEHRAQTEPIIDPAPYGVGAEHDPILQPPAASRSQERRRAIQDVAQTGQPAEGDRVDVTYLDCTVRRVSTGALGRTWVTAEAPSGIVLDFDLGETSIEVRPSGERAVAAAEAEPGVLVLPDGWERVNYDRGSRAGELSHCLRQASGLCEEDFYANPEPDGMVEMSGVAFELDEAKEVHARLGEAIRITEQLRAGAR